MKKMKKPKTFLRKLYLKPQRIAKTLKIFEKEDELLMLAARNWLISGVICILSWKKLVTKLKYSQKCFCLNHEKYLKTEKNFEETLL